MDSVEIQALIIKKLENVDDLNLLWIIKDFVDALIGNNEK